MNKAKAWNELTGPRARARAFKARHGFWENYGNEAKKTRRSDAHHEGKAPRGGQEGSADEGRALQEEALEPAAKKTAAKKAAAKKTGAK